MNAKQLPRELYLFSGSKEVAEKIYKIARDEQMKNTKELVNLETDLGAREIRMLKRSRPAAKSRRVLWTNSG